MRFWRGVAFLAFGVVATIALIVVAIHTAPSTVTVPPMPDSVKHSRILTEIIPHWSADYPQPLLAEQLSKGSSLPLHKTVDIDQVTRYVWSPADLCDDITPNRWTRRSHGDWTTMQWCPQVAFTLIQWPAWTVYDLTALMSIMGCESSGDPYWNEKVWGTFSMSVFGLLSHRRVYWRDRTMTYLGRVGNHYEIGQKDDIALGVALYMDDGPWHWGSDGGCWGPGKRTLQRES